MENIGILKYRFRLKEGDGNIGFEVRGFSQLQLKF